MIELTAIGHSDLGGSGDGSQIAVRGSTVAVAHMGAGSSRLGTSLLDLSDPTAPEVVAQRSNEPGTHSHKVAFTADGLLLVNQERNDLWERDAPTWRSGLALVDPSDPSMPEVAWLPFEGKGVHRMSLAGDLALMSASADGVRDQFLHLAAVGPGARLEARGTFRVPGMGEDEVPPWPDDERWAAHHALVRDTVAYCSWWDGGTMVLDVADPWQPQLLGHHRLPAGTTLCTHSVLPLPGRDVVVVVDEQTERRAEIQRKAWLVALDGPLPTDLLSQLPEPPRPDPPYGRFGPHNVHEMVGGGALVSGDLVFLTYFSGGMAVYDVRDARRPELVARFHPGLPGFEANDVHVTAEGLCLVTDRHGLGFFVVPLPDELLR